MKSIEDLVQNEKLHHHTEVWVEQLNKLFNGFTDYLTAEETEALRRGYVYGTEDSYSFTGENYVRYRHWVEHVKKFENNYPRVFAYGPTVTIDYDYNLEVEDFQVQLWYILAPNRHLRLGDENILSLGIFKAFAPVMKQLLLLDMDSRHLLYRDDLPLPWRQYEHRVV